MSEFALFKDGTQVSKAHSTRGAAMMEAFQRKAVISWSQDFWSDPAPGVSMASGYEVKALAGSVNPSLRNMRGTGAIGAE